MSDEFASVPATGARPGDTVICVSVTDESLKGIRYVEGGVYTVVDHHGKPAVQGQSHGKKCGAGEEKWLIPFSGYGAMWRLSDGRS